MRKSRKIGRSIAILKKKCNLTKNEAEMLFYIICCRVRREVKPAREILNDFKQDKIELKKESPYYRRLIRLNVMG